MSENSSNSCTSPSCCRQHNLPVGKSSLETYASIQKLPPPSERKPSTLVRDLGRRKLKDEATSSSNLESGAEEVEDEEEFEFSMGKLIRQASLNSSHSLPKAMSDNASRMKQEFDSLKLERLRPRRVMSRLKTQKSMSDLQLRELHSFKGLGLQGSHLSRSTPPTPSTQETPPEKRTTEEDMKAQIKFWARTVASNVR